MRPVGSHAIDRGHRTECHAALVGSFVAHDSYALNGEEYGAGLPDFVVEACLPEDADIDAVNFLKDMDFLRGYLAYDADAEPRSRERMAPNQFVADA